MAVAGIGIGTFEMTYLNSGIDYFCLPFIISANSSFNYGDTVAAIFRRRVQIHELRAFERFSIIKLREG